jgi:hypothetical protein
MRVSHLLFVLLMGTWLGPVGSLVAAGTSRVSGRGTYFVMPDTPAEFEFDETHVQCKVPPAVLPDGTQMEMVMNSTSIDSVTIDRKTKRAIILGSNMSSVTTLRFPDGSAATLIESVPFMVDAKDNDDNQGTGNDFFGLKVDYDPNASGANGLNQYKLFGATATNPTTDFSGVLVSGDIEVLDLEQAQFFFAVNSGGGNTSDRVNLNGAGSFGIGFVKGSGTFTRLTPTGSPPFPLVNFGTWRATRFLSFAETPGSPYGQVISGILSMEVELRPMGSTPFPATMEVICNAAGGALLTGEDEGVKLTLSDGTTFGPIGQGQTIFGPGNLEDN